MKPEYPGHNGEYFDHQNCPQDPQQLGWLTNKSSRILLSGVLVERAFDAAAVTAAHNPGSAVMGRTFQRGMKSALMATPQPKIAVNSCVPPIWDSSNLPIGC